MVTMTANHLYCSTVLECHTGAWINETAQWGLRFAVGGGGGVLNEQRPATTEGQIDLNTFDCHTAIGSRSLTASGIAGTLLTAWTGDTSPVEECVTDNDIDFLISQAMSIVVAMKSYYPNWMRLRHIKLYAVKADGKAPLGPNTWTPTAAYAGSSSANLSPEVAAVCSLYTAHRAKAGRGRMFFGPLAQSVINTEGLFTSTLTGALGSAVKSVQDTVRTRGTPGSSACYVGIVWNRVPGTHGCVISKIRVGDEPDHQERRTKKRPEIFADLNVV